ncbi:uncharacterized protein LOC128246353 [Mya arenaria]|uniref:uncharacterized protein LOC128246353 n=1 Tax=Mya arenaria TaxID=6604 RepID=UPI0022E48D63|nr:uncharacterized protein LOC128246353 [Mya arenaria]
MASLNMTVLPSYPVLGQTYPDFNTTKCIYVYEGSDFYCKTENGTEPVKVLVLLGEDSFVLAESKWKKGLYRFRNVHQEMAGLSRQNVTCQVSNAALETPYEVHGILCNVEKGSPPLLTVPELLDGESSKAICEVRNAIPAPLIQIRVDKVWLADVQRTDSFNVSFHTFTSKATVSKTNKDWNGKEMCCVRKSKDDFGLNNVSLCKSISIRYPPSQLSMFVNKIHEYSNNVSVCFLNISCETDESNPPCIIECSSGTDSLRNVYRNDLADGENWRNRSFSNVLYNVTKYMAGATITCSTRCDHFQSRLNKTYNVSISDIPTLYLNMTSPVVLHPNFKVTVKCFVDDLNNSGQWDLWWEDENSTEIKACIKAEECLLTLSYTVDGDKRYICNTRKPRELLRNSLTVSSSRTDGSESDVNDNQTFPSTFRFPANDVLIGGGVFCGICIMSVIGNTTSDNGVLHIATEGVQYAVVQRQASTQRIETQQSHDVDSLTYAELDIKFLQEANARVPPRRKITPTEYADIEFFLTQESAVDDPVYHNASASDQDI